MILQAQPLAIKECRGCHSESTLRGPAVVRMVEEKKMPPGKPLAPEAIKAIRDWVDAGAPWTEPKAERVWPFGVLGSFDKSKSIDDFLKSGPAADRRTLIRRVTIDLTGPPPTPVELETSDSWPKIVERLLASPRH